MPSTGKGRRDEFSQRVFMPGTPRFSVVMANRDVGRGKIAISRDFIVKYRNYLSSSWSVLLKAPSGESFKVKLEYDDGRVWLGRGWRHFEEYYSIKKGSQIYFKLRASNVFKVMIFGSRGTEIDYPIDGGRNKRPILTVDSVEESDEEHAMFESSEASEPPHPRRGGTKGRHGTSKTCPIVLDDSSFTDLQEPELESESAFRPEDSDLESEDENPGAGMAARPEEGANPNQSQFSRGLAGRKPRIEKKPLLPSSHKALEAAMNYQPRSPAFWVQLRPSYMRSGGVSIRAQFMKENNLQPGPSEVKLEHGSKSWTVKMLCYAKERRGKLCGGWSKFLEDNHVLNGDVCVFELVGINAFKVRFFRCSSYT